MSEQNDAPRPQYTDARIDPEPHEYVSLFHCCLCMLQVLTAWRARAEQAEATIADLREELAVANAVISDFQNEMVHYVAEEAQAKVTLVALREALEQVEWVSDGLPDGDLDDEWCPWCAGNKHYGGHRAACVRQRLLASALPPATPQELVPSTADSFLAGYRAGFTAADTANHTPAWRDRMAEQAWQVYRETVGGVSTA